MKTRKHKRVMGRVIPYDREKLRDVLKQFDLDLSDEVIAPYQPWEERLLGAVNGLLANHLSSEEEATTQALGQYKLFCYWMENCLPDIIADNPGASGKLLLAIAAQRYTTELMLWAQRRQQAEEEAWQENGRERPAW